MRHFRRSVDKGFMLDSVPREVTTQMLMALGDGLGLGTYSTCYPVTLGDAQIAPCLKVRMVNFVAFSAYSSCEHMNTFRHFKQEVDSPVLTPGQCDKIFKITQLELKNSPADEYQICRALAYLHCPKIPIFFTKA